MNLVHLKKKTVEKKESTTANDPIKTVKSKKSKSKSIVVSSDQTTGNLPNYYTERNLTKELKLEPQIAAPSKIKQTLDSVAIGDIFDAVINHHIIAFNDEKTPVLAVITSGKLKGYRALGEATLNDSNESIFIELKAISNYGKSYSMTATGLNEIGQTYFATKYHSNEKSLFAGTFIATMAAAYFDGLIPRSSNPYGQIQTDNSVDSALKKGIAAGAMETAQMFKEKLKKAKSFGEVRAPVKLKILINDTIVEK